MTATKEALRKAIKLSQPKKGRKAIITFLQNMPESEPCDGKAGENAGWRRLTPKRLLTLIEEDMIPPRRDMENHHNTFIGGEKRKKLLKALRIYAEKGVELPIWSDLAKIIGWETGASVTHHIRALHAERHITYVNRCQTIHIEFPDGKATKPRSWNPAIRMNTDD